MPTNLPPIWQILLASALVSGVVTWFLNFITEFVTHRRAKVEHFQKMMLDRKFEAINRAWHAVYQLTSNIAPYSNGSRAFENDPGTQWEAYQAEMRPMILEVYGAFNENALILGAPIWRVWVRYRQELDYFGITARHDRVHLPHLVQFCSGFPADLKEAITRSLHDPTISILSIEEETDIRKRASAYLESPDAD